MEEINYQTCNVPLFGIGKIVLGEFGAGFLLLSFGALMVLAHYMILSRVGWEQVVE